MNDKFYSSQAWREKSLHILRRDKYTDQLELRAGRHVPAELVHHILPLSKYPQYALTDWNLISISRETHAELHTMFGELTEAGRRLMLETAHKHEISLSQLVLVIGLPATGKTAFVRQRLKSGLVYDIDYIAAAFRLAQPKKDGSDAARRMANSMVKSFAINARRYAETVYVIRVAPTIEEVEAIEPDKIVVCKRQYEPKPVRHAAETAARIGQIEAWAEDNGVPVLVIE